MIEYDGTTFNTLKEAIASIPGEDGWHKSNSELAYLTSAQYLVRRGFTEEEAFSLLNSLYWGAASCFGG